MTRQSLRISWAITLCVIVGAVLVIGCTQMVYRVHDEPIVTGGIPKTLDHITEAIVEAGKKTRIPWSMNVVEPGFIIGTLRWQQHRAVVNINYTLDKFSINYRDSVFLRYEPGNETRAAVIGRHYNQWVMELEDAIRSSLLLVNSKSAVYR
jgi:hypothetical protein